MKNTCHSERAAEESGFQPDPSPRFTRFGMTLFIYDKTWEGLLTAVWDVFYDETDTLRPKHPKQPGSEHIPHRIFPERLIGEGEPVPLFAEAVHRVVTDPEHAARVWRGLEKMSSRSEHSESRDLSSRVGNMLLYAWLSEEEGADELIFRYLCKIFAGTKGGGADGRDGLSGAGNFADEDVLRVHQIALKVAREGEHVRQFLRFQKAADGSYFAPIAPKYNALPLALDYLTERFATQRWLVYDTRRHYGYLFDTQQVTEITMENDAHLIEGKLSDEILAADEKLFQQTWRDYLGALTIRQRLNPRLQRQHMPVRFWKYLTEKAG